MTMKRWLALMIIGMLVMMPWSGVAAQETNDRIDAIRKTAEAEKYRFILIGDEGITDSVRQDLAQNDSIFLKEEPTGSVKIQVIDATTGKPVEKAECFLSFSSNRSVVNVDGSKEQIANPFLLFDVGQTDRNGELVFEETYFYSTKVVTPGTKPFADSLSVLLAYIDDADPELSVKHGQKNYIQTSDPETFQAIVDRIGGRTNLMLSELKEIIRSVASQKYNEVLRYLFADGFVAYSDRVRVRVPDAPQYRPLIDSGRQVLAFGELKTYLDENRDLFVRYVAERHFDDFGGFEPNFGIRHQVGYDSVTTYRDGSQATSSGTNYISTTIFDKVEGGTGYAIHVSSFSYRVYVFADGYESGRTIGSVISQNLVEQDVVHRVYVSKDSPPVSAKDKSNVLTGTLVNEKDQPISGASIQIRDTTLKTTTDALGRFTFPTLTNESVKLVIIDPENGKDMLAKAIYKGEEYPIDQIPIDLAGENEWHELSLVGGVAASTAPRTTNPAATTLSGGGTGRPDRVTDDDGFAGTGTLLLIIGLLLVAIILFLLLVKRKKKDVCRQCGATLGKDMNFCTRCGTPRER